MAVFDTSLTNIKFHKQRTFSFSKKPKLIAGEYGIIASNESKMELIHLTFLKKCLKVFNIKKKSNNKNSIKNLKIWLSILPNATASRKSKNSRMGKGKGMFDRWMFKIQQGSVIAEFIGVPKYRLIKMVNYLNKKFKIKLHILSKVRNSSICNWAKQNQSIDFFNKYRFI